MLRLEVTPGVMHQRSQAGAGSSSIDSHTAADSAGAAASTARVVPGTVEHVLWLGESMSMETGVWGQGVWECVCVCVRVGMSCMALCVCVCSKAERNVCWNASELLSR